MPCPPSYAFHRGICEVQADFALKLLRTLMWRKAHSNCSFVTSPSCVSIVLSMVHGGAQGETEREIRKLLANDIIAAQLHLYTHQLLQTLLTYKLSCSLELVNKIFIKEAFGVQNEFRLFVDTHFGTNNLELVEFGAGHSMAPMINKLFEYLTRRNVQNLIRPETIGKFTNMLLVNAIYLKTKWPVEFYTTCVHPIRFYMSETLHKDVKITGFRIEKKTDICYPFNISNLQINMLHSVGIFDYFENVDFQLLGIPLSGAELSLFVALPRQTFGLSQLLLKLTGNLLHNFVRQCSGTEIYVNMPKFKLESEHYLKEPLRSLGIVQAFGDKAQFGKITHHALSNINISQIVQKAILEIDEEGVTSINARNSRSNWVVKFIADHPFAFFVANRSCENILMAGIFCGLESKLN